VTIFGESAGAANVTLLMASPLAAGLFHRAIAQSGYFGPNTSHLTRGQGPRRPSAHQTGLDFAARLGVTGSDDAALAALRQLPVEKLLSVPLRVGSIVGKGGGRAFRLAPVVDGWVLPRDPRDVWAAGDMHKVPFIAGSLLDDGSVFSRANPVRRVFGYRLVMRSIFGPDAERALALFPAARDEDVHAAVHRVTTLLSFRAPARRLVRWVEAAGGDAWLYHFARNPRRGRAAREGVFHGLEIGYVFQSLKSLGDETDKRVAADMTARWVHFARDGDPNGGPDEANPPRPRWPEYQTAADQHLEFNDQVRVGTGLDREACDLLDRVAARRAKK
jgi:para-nitrobenzyl esterase